MSNPSNIQQALKNWNVRSGQFTSAGVPPATWSVLMNHDMEGVYAGRAPMTNAEVYAGVKSAVLGPQVQDPTNVVAHHSSVLQTIWDVTKNVPKDVSSIILGLEGIPHILMHLPSEADNTYQLIDHLATKDNSWLAQHGYIPQGSQINDGWSGLALMLRAMNANGSKQLLPFIPFISDLANMTSGQGRQYLEQHPVGAFLDILPGITKVGHLALDSVPFELNATERADKVSELIQKGMPEKQARTWVNKYLPADYSHIYRGRNGAHPAGAPTPRFFGAGVALQQGNPIKALLSATGDLIPMGVDKFGAHMTLRDFINIRSSSAGLDTKIRELINRPVNNIADELTAKARWMKQKLFGDTTFFKADENSVKRQMILWQVENGVDPRTAQMFTSVDARNAYINANYGDMLLSLPALNQMGKFTIDTANSQLVFG